MYVCKKRTTECNLFNVKKETFLWRFELKAEEKLKFHSRRISAFHQNCRNKKVYKMINDSRSCWSEYCKIDSIASKYTQWERSIYIYTYVRYTFNYVMLNCRKVIVMVRQELWDTMYLYSNSTHSDLFTMFLVISTSKKE